MTFVAQIDSIEHDYDNNPTIDALSGEQHFMFGDVGMCSSASTAEKLKAFSSAASAAQLVAAADSSSATALLPR